MEGRLGEIRREFKPGLENLVAGIIIGLLLIGGGCAAFFFAAKGVVQNGGNLPIWTKEGQKGWSWGAAGILTAIGVGLIIGGIFMIRWIRSLFSFRVCVGQNGFAVSDKGSVRIIGWDDIVSVQETHLYERPPILKGVAKFVLPKMKSKSYIVSVKEGEPIEFDGNSIKGHSSLADMIRQVIEPRNIPWKIVEEQGY